MLELVVQHLAHRRAEGAVTVPLPHLEVLPDAVDLDRLEDDMDGGGPEESTRQDDDGQPQASARVQPRDVLEPEEFLPERDVPGLDGNEGLQRAAQAVGGDGMQGTESERSKISSRTRRRPRRSSTVAEAVIGMGRVAPLLSTA